MEEFAENEEVLFPKHYTRLPGLINILESKAFWLSDPDKWEDKNDCAAVNAYKRITGAEKIRAFCLANGLEMVHHWFAYAKGKDGCCIFLNKEKILGHIKGNEHFLTGPVLYYSQEDLTAKKLREIKEVDEKQLPFIKRRPYECEQEYRILWTGKTSEPEPFIPIKDCIEYVTLSPRFNEYTAETVSSMLLNKYGIKTKRSRILESNKLISLFNSL
jgi:mRNA deadenylase 3'-5' endonuclease subunit Ccr4